MDTKSFYLGVEITEIGGTFTATTNGKHLKADKISDMVKLIDTENNIAEYRKRCCSNCCLCDGFQKDDYVLKCMKFRKDNQEKEPYFTEEERKALSLIANEIADNINKLTIQPSTLDELIKVFEDLNFPMSSNNNLTGLVSKILLLVNAVNERRAENSRGISIGTSVWNPYEPNDSTEITRIITEVEDKGDDFVVTMNDGFNTLIAKKYELIPKVGDEITTYGNPHIHVKGIEINGHKIIYKDEVEK